MILSMASEMADTVSPVTTRNERELRECSGPMLSDMRIAKRWTIDTGPTGQVTLRREKSKVGGHDHNSVAVRQKATEGAPSLSVADLPASAPQDGARA